MQRERVSADNPMFREHEEIEVKAFGQRYYDDAFHTDVNSLQASEEYSRLNHSVFDSQRISSQPHHTISSPHYSSLNLKVSNEEGIIDQQVLPKNLREHQYEDIDKDGSERKVAEKELDKRVHVLSTDTGCYDDVIFTPSQTHKSSGCTKLVQVHGHEKHDEVKDELRVEPNSEDKKKDELENAYMKREDGSSRQCYHLKQISTADIDREQVAS